MTPKRFLREVVDLVAAEGSTVLTVADGNRGHRKLTIRTPAGPRLLVISWSPSDRRVLGNVRKDIRRLMRAESPQEPPAGAGR